MSATMVAPAPLESDCTEDASDGGKVGGGRLGASCAIATDEAIIDEQTTPNRQRITFDIGSIRQRIKEIQRRSGYLYRSTAK